jgi:hypothetical protein
MGGAKRTSKPHNANYPGRWRHIKLGIQEMSLAPLERDNLEVRFYRPQHILNTPERA